MPHRRSPPMTRLRLSSESGNRQGRPKRSLGQNFLVDPNIQRKIVSALSLSPDDLVLEIGPGRGALTQHLVGQCRRLFLVELDDSLAADLEARYADNPDIQVIHADILTVSFEELTEDPGELRVVGNIPYNITAPILFKLLERPRPRDILMMVQHEVARRIVAVPGSAEYGAMAVGVQTVAKPEMVMQVPRGAFRPVPGVDSSIVRITPKDPAPISLQEEQRLRVLTRAAFQWRRKQFQKILRDHSELSLSRGDVERLGARTGWDLTRRPETFSPDEFLRLQREIETL